MSTDEALARLDADQTLGAWGGQMRAGGVQSPPSWSHLRVLIAHDWITAWAGSERCVEQMLAIFPQADLVVGLLGPGMRDFNAVTRRARETWLARLPGARTHHRWFLPLEAAAFATLDTRRYDLVLSSSHAFSKMVRTKATRTLHISYCHSPPRYLWDLGATYRSQARWAERIALRSATSALRRLDRYAATRVDHFICNSRYVADRVRRAYDREAQVVYPPVAQKPVPAEIRSREDFLLSLGRLVPYKRVDLAIRAAEVAGVRLIVAGDGPERARLKAMAGPHTHFVGAVTEREAADLLERCAAFVFCAEEDFGIAPVEANAHGAPVVAFAKGGVLESMRESETAVFFREQSVAAAAEAVHRALSRRWDDRALRANASRFTPRAFRSGLLSALAAHLA